MEAFAADQKGHLLPRPTPAFRDWEVLQRHVVLKPSGTAVWRCSAGEEKVARAVLSVNAAHAKANGGAGGSKTRLHKSLRFRDIFQISYFRSLIRSHTAEAVALDPMRLESSLPGQFIFSALFQRLKAKVSSLFIHHFIHRSHPIGCPGDG